MDDLLKRTRRWSLPLVLLFYRGLPSAFFICSLEYIAPEKQNYWCIDDSGARRHNGTDQCHYLSGDGRENACTAWEYQIKSTLTSEFNAVCDRKDLRRWAQSALMFGMMMGNLIFSHISDWYGRRTICLLSHLCILGGGIACSFAPTFPVWISLRIIMSLGLGGNQNGPFTLGMESTNPKNRALLAVGDTFGWVAGMIVLPIFPYFIHDWRQLQFAISLSTVPMLMMAWYVDESPRWLVATRKIERVKTVVGKILERNGMQRSPDDVDDIISRCVQEHQKALSEPKTTLVDLFKTPGRALTTISLYLQYPLNILVYYNLFYLILALDTGGLFANLLWAGLFETPVLLLVYLLVEHFNRRSLHFMCNFSAVVCCAVSFLYPGMGALYQLLLATIAKMGVQVDYSVLGVHVNEIYPTRVRGIALGSCVTISRLGAILSPFAHDQDTINESLLNSLACLVALFLVIPLRETYGKPLPDKFEDADNDQSELGVEDIENAQPLLDHDLRDDSNVLKRRCSF
ncbi:solute carrier family 22 member 5 [Galendromus occidentalis]|uniref:Solute carrier family 22 member 5 n=1 Tax=Galendromus occidentalis TaxID=34638 RepID=A0AAJ6QXG2_9ACAR|nr:solute carrier family 22 member 5 [Galendromus occidentalis]